MALAVLGGTGTMPLAGLDGVLAVEEDHTFQLPPPDADLQ